MTNDSFTHNTVFSKISKHSNVSNAAIAGLLVLKNYKNKTNFG